MEVAMRYRFLTAMVLLALIMSLVGRPAQARPDEQLFGEPCPPAANSQYLPTYYLVSDGDTLWSIAQRYGVRPEVIAQANGMSCYDVIYAGDHLVIPAGGLTHRVVEGDTLWGLALRYGVALEELLSANGLSADEPLFVGSVLLIPVPSEVTVLADGRGSRGLFNWPVEGPVTSPFGFRDGRPHEGLDIAADTGTPVRAAAAGRVVYAGPAGTYGLLVILSHAGGWATYYAHCDGFEAAVGEEVTAGEVIATVGNTGHSTGPHLHFEVRLEGVPYDPAAFLP
jgi:murein DD-endopeptidase MepM/ murein hydrolase activator NlpD